MCCPIGGRWDHEPSIIDRYRATARFPVAASMAQVLDDLHLDIAPGQFVALLGSRAPARPRCWGSGRPSMPRPLEFGAALAHGNVPCCSRISAPAALADGAGQPDAGLGRRRSGPPQYYIARGGLEDKAGLPATLSGGQSKDGHWLVLLREPHVLLADEPLAPWMR